MISPNTACPLPASRPRIGLLLSGGGARAAYQVGVLQSLAQLQREARSACATDTRHAPEAPAAPEAHAVQALSRNPFDVITGTSAGAINAAALACGSDDFQRAVRRLAGVWRQFKPHQVYRADALATLDVPGRWRMLLGLAQLLVRWRRAQPQALLNNQPLAQLLERLLPLHTLAQRLQDGHLAALAITASSYSTGEHFTFYQSGSHQAPMQPWTRSQRQAVAGPITHAHLLASAAIPFVFPATALPLDGQPAYFGDGAMRQTAPISPVIHLGAERVLVIGAGRLHEPPAAMGSHTLNGYPSLAQMAGHTLSSIFLDTLAADVERLERINQTLQLIPPQARAHTRLRPIELLVLTPSARIDDIAARHVHALPSVVRRLLRVQQTPGTPAEQAGKASALASYLLFEARFTRELMALGRADTLKRRDEVMRFLGWAPSPAPHHAPPAAPR